MIDNSERGRTFYPIYMGASPSVSAIQASPPADAEGFLGPWGVASDYVVADGVLIPKGSRARAYVPIDFPQIVTELAKVNENDVRTIISFARKWGSLGYLRLVDSDTSLPDEKRQRLLALGGDPLIWVGAHARSVHICLTILRYLSNGQQEDEQLGNYLQSLAGPSEILETDDLGILALSYGVGYQIRTMSYGFPKAVGMPDARTIIKSIINQNMNGLVIQLGQGHLRSPLGISYAYVALINVVYWHLLQMAIGKVGVGQCEDCGAYFPSTDKRQRFCPPYEGTAGLSGRAESVCGRRSRMKRFRAKAKVKEQIDDSKRS